MTITNGYLTLAEFKDAFFQQRTLTASTLSFSGSSVSDTQYRLAKFPSGGYVIISGSSVNTGLKTVVTSTAASLTFSGSVATEQAGNSVTITDVSDQIDDAEIDAVITAVSRMIDGYTGRRFYVTPADETRYYTASDGSLLMPEDDIISITTLKTDDNGDGTYETTWSTSDYALQPVNAGLNGRPYLWINTTSSGSCAFPHGVNGVQIAGKFGYSVVCPAVIRQVCLIQSLRIFKRKDTPFGVMGSGDMGQAVIINDLDPDVRTMLNPYVRVLI